MTLSDFRNKVEQNPENILFRFSLAQQLVQSGMHEEAIEHLTRCTAQKPDWMMAHILLGEALLKAGKPQKAKPILAQALQLAIDQHHEEPQEAIQTLLKEAGLAQEAHKDRG